jgi:hypothetical protein
MVYVMMTVIFLRFGLTIVVLPSLQRRIRSTLKFESV